MKVSKMDFSLKTRSLIVAMLFIALASTELWALTAREVMQQVDDRDTGDTAIAETVMVLIDKRKNQRVRQMKRFDKEFGEDSKSIIFFRSPADVRNTSFLSFDWDDDEKDDDSWLFLPALQKVKRIASNDKSGSFMGSDFTYSDMSGLNIDDWEYSFDQTKEEQVEGQEAWVIIGVPKNAKKEKVIDETGYIKAQLWVRKDNSMIVKGKFWVKKGRKIKYLTVEKIKKVKDIWTAFEIKMVTTRRGKMEHATIIKTGKIEYNISLDENMFTTQRMERGI